MKISARKTLASALALAFVLRVGLVPDVEVKPTIKGVREGRDEVLERALEYLRSER